MCWGAGGKDSAKPANCLFISVLALEKAASDGCHEHSKCYN